VEQHTDAPRPDEWDVDGLYAAVTSMFGTELAHGPEELQGLGKEDLTETVFSWAEELYQEKERQYSPALMQLAARGTLLRIIDGLWVEHLTAIDDMIAGIGLRAFGQRDPLTEYKGEAYRMFQNLLQDIQANLANAIFRIQFVAQPIAMQPPATAPDAASEGEPGAAPEAPGAPEAAPAPVAAGVPAPPRRLVTNRPVDGDGGAVPPGAGGRPVLVDGRVVSRAERRRLEKAARRGRNRPSADGR
jgi:preprotein translocase subunit SecA